MIYLPKDIMVGRFVHKVAHAVMHTNGHATGKDLNATVLYGRRPLIKATPLTNPKAHLLEILHALVADLVEGPRLPATLVELRSSLS